MALAHAVRPASRSAVTDPAWVRRTLIAVSAGFLGLFLLLPLAAVFTEALRKGFGAYLAALTDPAALSAIQLTLTAAAIAVPVNIVFGLAAAWAIARFRFVGRNVLITLI